MNHPALTLQEESWKKLIKEYNKAQKEYSQLNSKSTNSHIALVIENLNKAVSNLNDYQQGRK